MKMLREKWQLAGQSFDAKTPRERALLAVAVIVGTVLLGNMLLLDPLLVRSRQVQKQIDQQKQEAQMLTEQAALLTEQVRSDPDAVKKTKANHLRADLAGIESELNALAVSFVPPEEMDGLLENLLAGYPRLRLVSLKSLPPVNLAEAGSADTPAPAGRGGAAIPNRSSGAETERVRPPAPSSNVGLFRHGVEIQLEGSYRDLHAWLAQMETAQQKLLWGGLRFSVVEYPRARIVLTVYTLSTDKAWLAI